jgi:hypothetical protein
LAVAWSQPVVEAALKLAFRLGTSMCQGRRGTLAGRRNRVHDGRVESSRNQKEHDMASTGAASEAAIREQAYLLWEQEGRPHGREMEFWTRAKVAVAEKAQMDTLTKAPPKPKAKVVAKGKVEAPSRKAAPKADGKDKPKKK